MLKKGDHPGKASVVFLPMLNLNPIDMSCIYSTLIFLADQAKTNSTIAVITFILCLLKAARLYAEVTDTGQVCQQIS